MHPQQPLLLGLKDSTVFDNFVIGSNAELVAYLKRPQYGAGSCDDASKPPCVFLWGNPGSGKTHLLQAVCHAAGSHSAAALYLPLRAADEFPLEALNGLENIDFICIDDIEAIAGDEAWEVALLKLFERVQQAGGGLVITGASAPAELALQPPLTSRLGWGIIFQLKPLSDTDKSAALTLRAARRGFKLPPTSAKFLVSQHGDDMGRLFEWLETLDKASLAAKRRLTVPFIREVLSLDR